MKIYLAVILYFLINSNSLNAHELWLEADQYQLKDSEKLIVNIKVGQDLVGESYPYLSQETEKLFLVSKKGFKKLNQIDGDYPAIQQSVNYSGIQYLYYQSNKEFLKYQDYKTFIEFTDEYDLNYDLKNKNIPNEIYQRFAKIIFNGQPNSFFKTKQNLEFEIVNQNDPYDNNLSEIQIFLKNKPFINKKFIVFFKNENAFERKIYQTDKNGFAKIDSSKKGLYLISAVHLETLNLIDQIKYKADYYSRWASLTFRKN
jgi:cobalt/nickel transport protein